LCDGDIFEYYKKERLMEKKVEKTEGNDMKKANNQEEINSSKRELSAVGKWLNDSNAAPFMKIIDMRAVLK
jgi:hypothetical protein